jgi:hypothetical protein
LKKISFIEETIGRELSGNPRIEDKDLWKVFLILGEEERRRRKRICGKLLILGEEEEEAQEEEE